MYSELWFALNALDIAISGIKRQIQAEYKFEAG
jgi:hypothetical protein